MSLKKGAVRTKQIEGVGWDLGRECRRGGEVKIGEARKRNVPSVHFNGKLRALKLCILRHTCPTHTLEGERWKKSVERACSNFMTSLAIFGWGRGSPNMLKPEDKSEIDRGVKGGRQDNVDLFAHLGTKPTNGERAGDKVGGDSRGKLKTPKTSS